MAIDVLLDWYEIENSSYTGFRRQIEILRNNSKKDEEGAFERHIQAAGAERAFAKATDRYDPGSVNTFKRVGDIGRGKFEVRHTFHKNGHLIIYPDDPNDRVYVLVVGRMPKYAIIGCIGGGAAKRKEWKKTLPSGTLVYYVPQSALEPAIENR